MSNFDDYFKSMHRLTQLYNPLSAMIESNVKFYNQIRYSPAIDAAESLNAISKMLTSNIDYYPFGREGVSALNAVSDFQKNFLSALSSVSMDCLALPNSFISTVNPLASQTDFMQLCSSQANVFSAIAAIQNISIHENYVSVPEELIPDDFDYEEIPTEKSDLTINESSHANKNISFSDALNILNMIITVLLWLISTFQNSSSTKPQINNVAVESVSSATEEQVQQIIDLLSTLSIQQQELIDLLESSEGSDPKPYSASDDIQPQFAVPGPEQIVSPESSSTSHHECDSSELQTEPELQ